MISSWRVNLKGKTLMWVLRNPGFIRINNLIIRWETTRNKNGNE